MGSLNLPHTLRSTIDKGPLPYLDQATGSTSTPKMAKSATRDDVKMDILRGTKGIDDYYARANVAEPPAPTASLGTTQQICNYWYHGRCYSQDKCKFVHRLDPSLQLNRGQTVKHKTPCGLDRCRYNNDVMSGKSRPRADSVTGHNSVALATVHKQKPTEGQTQGQKRKFVNFHADDARQWGSIKTGEVDYDGRDNSDHLSTFTSHGGRSLSTSPNTPQTTFNSYVEGLLRTLQPQTDSPVGPPILSTGRDSTVKVPKDAAQSNIDHPRKKSRRAKAAAAKETCFFWYHGSCGRLKRSECPYLHELTDPPTMVQPPPGYVHRQPCVKEWCPGDARVGQTSRGNERGREGTGAHASGAKDTGGDGKHNDQLEDNKPKDSQEDWFLTGFDEPE